MPACGGSTRSTIDSILTAWRKAVYVSHDYQAAQMLAAGGNSVSFESVRGIGHRIFQTMNVHTYRYGEPDGKPGLHVGVTQYLPRGVRREDYATLGYFDVWIPLLAPSRELLAAFREGQFSYARFAREYRKAMRQPAARQAIRLLAATAAFQPVHLGCFCADPARCHRTLLRNLVIAAASDLPKRPAKSGEFFSPACAMPEIED